MFDRELPEITLYLEPVESQIKVDLDSYEQSINVELVAGGESSSPTYFGPYTVTPSMDPQILETKKRLMVNDVTVLEIPYYKTTNQSGGYTAIIGG